MEVVLTDRGVVEEVDVVTPVGTRAPGKVVETFVVLGATVDVERG